MDAKPFRAKCPFCATMMQFVPRAAQCDVKCPSCGQRFRVKIPGWVDPPATVAATSPGGGPPARTSPARPAPANPTAMPRSSRPAGQPRRPAGPSAGANPAATRPAAARPAAAARPKAPRAAAPAADPLDWDALPSPSNGASYRPAAGRGALAGFPAASGRAAPARAPKRSGGGGGGKAIKVVLILGGTVTGGALLLVMLVVGLGMLGRMPQGKKTVTLDGWSVDAPGIVGPEKNVSSGRERGVLHRTTGSEFSLTVGNVQAGQTLSEQDLMTIVRMMFPGARNVQTVQRAGLGGVAFEGLMPSVGVEARVEVFLVGTNKLIVLSYISAHEKELIGKAKPRFDRDKTKELDNPDAFFASLRKAG